MIALACDHGGFALKQTVVDYLKAHNLEFKDFGCYDTSSCDYPLYAQRAAKAVAGGDCRLGILICGTGIGISIAANKVQGIRCAVCGEEYSAHHARLHNNANMLALGARVIGPGKAEAILDAFFGTEFAGERHQRRVDMIMALDRGETLPDEA